MSELITVNDVGYRQGERCIFNGLSLQIEQGKITALMGPSGTGKTTLLRMITGQLQPEQGQIRVFGQVVAHLNQAHLMRLRQRMGVLFQSGALFTDMSVFDNVAFALREHTQLPETLIRTIVLLKLNAVGLRGAAELMPAQLSGGMARRVALARAIALDPELVLYDEPFAGQDPIGMGVLVQLIKSLNQSLGLTSVVISHDVKEVMSIADYIYLLSDGRVIEAGTPAQISRSQHAWTRQFIDAQDDGPVPFHYPAVALEQALLLPNTQ